MNAADFVAKRVLPYQDQQLSGTFGGPIRKDKLHFFANYEYEREPQTIIYTTPYQLFNLNLKNIRSEKKGGVRVDAQFSPRTRLAVRGTAFRFGPQSPVEKNTAQLNPSSQDFRYRNTNQVLATLTNVLTNRALNEVKVGYAAYTNRVGLLLKNPNARFQGFNGLQVLLRGQNVGGIRTFPEEQYQDSYSVRDDFTYSFSKGGRHNLKLGAEYLFLTNGELRCERCEGELDAQNGPRPANLESLFPDLFDASTWNLAPLSSISRTWRQAFGNFRYRLSRNSTAAWLQDDWSLSPRLTLNLGVRYDLELGAFGNDVALLPFLPKNRPEDTNNVSPRAGFSFSLNSMARWTRRTASSALRLGRYP
jgi:outer membrane receptor protein involved in Fe transport